MDYFTNRKREKKIIRNKSRQAKIMEMKRQKESWTIIKTGKTETQKYSDRNKPKSKRVVAA